MDWVHPTNDKQPKEVIMLLLGESKKDYGNILSLAHDHPFPSRPEIWTCNAGMRIWQHDLLFVMDDMKEEAYKWPSYGADLACSETPIITSTCYDEFPMAFEYPFLAICDALDLKGLNRYFYNTVPYMLAYALFIGVRRITLFGADYWHPNSPGREADLANCEWWLGYLAAKGVSLSLAPDTTLMRARQNDPLYGYRFDPRSEMDRRMTVGDQREVKIERPSRPTARERFDIAAAKVDGFGGA